MVELLGSNGAFIWISSSIGGSSEMSKRRAEPDQKKLEYFSPRAFVLIPDGICQLPNIARGRLFGIESDYVGTR
jgi:hypothetical protein